MMGDTIPLIKGNLNLRKKVARGFSLVEVLISVLVLAVGLLGLASLQVSSLRFNQESHQRSIATNQINEIVDRMRPNPVGVEDGNYDSASGTPTLPTCSTCTPAQIATKDISTWNTDNSTLLPAGQGTVTKVATNVFDVTVMWDSHRTGATGTNCSGNPNTDLTCITMRVEL